MITLLLCWVSSLPDTLAMFSLQYYLEGPWRMTGDDKMPCFDMLHWLLRLWCHQMVCDECSAPSSSCRHSETESGLCFWQGRKSRLLRYMYMWGFFLMVEKTCSLIIFSFPFYFFVLSFCICSVLSELWVFLKAWAEIFSLAALAFVTMIKGTFCGSARQ